jgi:hypothetical protein
VGFENDSFEIAAASGIPGEAEDWTWTAVQAAVEWAEFNTAALHVAYQRAREGYEAGFMVPWSWDYADATARLAAVGFTAADVDRFAIQRSDDTIWRLTNHSPITWAQLDTGWNQDWIAELIATIIGAAEFDGAPAPLEVMFEQWNRCVEDYDGDTVPDYIGPPWIWTDGNLKRQDDEVLGNLGPDYVGWKGWYDGALSTAQFPIPAERFAEDWGTTPFDMTAARWTGDQAPGGRLRGAALTFPVTIPPSMNVLHLYRQSDDAVLELEITPGEYATAAALAAEVQAQWGPATIVTNLSWSAWTDGDDAGIELAWDRVTPGAEMVLLGIAQSRRSNDARATLGLRTFGPQGQIADVRYPAALLVQTPPGTDTDEVFELDGWSQVEFWTDYELRFGFWNPIEYSGIPALFDAGVLTPSVLETFRVWHGGDIVWIAEYDPGDLTAAAFVGGVGAGAVFESFENPGTNWPDHIFTDA